MHENAAIGSFIRLRSSVAIRVYANLLHVLIGVCSLSSIPAIVAEAAEPGESVSDAGIQELIASWERLLEVSQPLVGVITVEDASGNIRSMEHYVRSTDGQALLEVRLSGDAAVGKAWVRNRDYSIVLTATNAPPDLVYDRTDSVSWQIADLIIPAATGESTKTLDPLLATPNKMLVGSADKLSSRITDPRFELFLLDSISPSSVSYQVRRREGFDFKRSDPRSLEFSVNPQLHNAVGSVIVTLSNGDVWENEYSYVVEKESPVLTKATFQRRGDAASQFVNRADLAFPVEPVPASFFTVSHFGIPEPALPRRDFLAWPIIVAVIGAIFFISIGLRLRNRARQN